MKVRSCTARFAIATLLTGTAMMLAECSSVGAVIAVTRVPKPEGVALERWLQTFPSYGYLLSVPSVNVPAVLARFAARDIAAADGLVA